MRIQTLALTLGLLALAGCGSSLTECVFSWGQTERLTYDGTNFNLILIGNGSTSGALFDDSGNGLPYAPSLRMQKNFTNTGGPYIQQAYTGLEPGRYRVTVQGSSQTGFREFTLDPGQSKMLQAECP